jgi:preprotein translocase subunit YajC
LNLISIVAQASNPTGPPSAPASGTQSPPTILNVVPYILLAVFLYLFVVMRPGKAKEQKRNDMLSKLKKGDEVQTIGGEFGRVVDVRDERVLLKVDETSNTKIWYARSAIHRIVTEEKAEAK